VEEDHVLLALTGPHVYVSALGLWNDKPTQSNHKA